MKKKSHGSSFAASFDPFIQNKSAGCERRLSSESENGIKRSLGTAEKDPTVHPETPRNNPTPG